MAKRPSRWPQKSGKAAEALLVIMGSVVGAILSFLGKDVEVVAKYA